MAGFQLPIAIFDETNDYSYRVAGRPIVNQAATGAGNNRVLAPTGQTIWWVQMAFVTLTSTATAGNRLVQFNIETSASVIIHQVQAGLVQAASLTRTYSFAPGFPRETAFSGVGNAQALCPFPPAVYINSAMQIRVLDGSAIDAADTLAVQLITQVYSAL